MAFRNLLVSSKAYVRSYQNRIRLENQESNLEIPFEDLGAVVLEGQQTTITSSVLQSIAESNSSLFVCDSKHLPVGVFLSFQNHSRQVKQIKKQLSVSDSFADRLWKVIIRAKINNQAEVLQILGAESLSQRLYSMANKVTVGDKTHRESYAASLYFPAMFKSGFTRSQELKINAALNYGYAIARGTIARHISAYGLLPSLGIHHKNEYNNFNLADDLIEPYRPFVDYFVKLYISNSEESELSKTDRASLLDILNMESDLNGKKFSLESSIDQVAKSLVSCINNNTYKDLLLPNIVKIKRKSYE